MGSTAVFFGPLLQASYRLCPQLSVGAGLGAARRGWHSVPTVFDPDFGLTIQTRNTSLCAPLWLRWHLSERPAARCQVALQAGVMLLSQTATTRLLDTGPNGSYVVVELAATTRRTLPLTLGLRLDYRVAPRWQVVGQVQTTALDANRFGGGASLGVACDW